MIALRVDDDHLPAVIHAVATPVPHRNRMEAVVGVVETVGFDDLLPSLFKALVFGFIIGLMGCFQGMRTSGGTEGVGRASTSAVVLSSLFVILADVVLVRLILMLFP